MADQLKATAADADLVLRLYDLRREAEMRKARKWFTGEFWPKSFEDVQKLMTDFGAQNNAWLRQVCSYWEMAAALVNHGTLNPNLFYDTCGEAWFVFTRMKPFLHDIRAVAPEFMRHLERVTEGTPEGRERVARMQQNFAHWEEMRKKQASAK